MESESQEVVEIPEITILNITKMADVTENMLRNVQETNQSLER